MSRSANNFICMDVIQRDLDLITDKVQSPIGVTNLTAVVGARVGDCINKIRLLAAE